MIDYVNADIREHRKGQDRVGVIVFGRDAAIEIPPFDDDVQVAQAIESVGRSRVHQSGGGDEAGPGVLSRRRRQADRAGQRRQPEPRQRGRAGPGAGRRGRGHRRAADPLSSPAGDHRRAGGDCRPTSAAASRSICAWWSPTPPSRRPNDSGEVPGRLVLSRTAGGRTDVLSDRAGGAAAGQEGVHASGRRSTRPNFYTYEARFVPDRPDDDAMPQNNRATAFTHVQGKGQVLLIEDCEHPRRVRRAGRSAAAAGARSRGAAEQPVLLHAGRIAALRHGGAGQRAPRAVQRRADRHARAEHAADGRRAW